MIFGILLSTSLYGCATAVSPFATEHENVWFIEHRTSTGSTVPIYCMANKKGDVANPKCYSSDTIDPPKTKSDEKKTFP
jgi:hypothetical protein